MIKHSVFQKGFNLPELVISILLLSTVIVIIIGIFTGGVIGIRKGTNRVIITNVLRSTLEMYSQEVLYDFDNTNYQNGSCLYISGEEGVDSLKIDEKWVSFKEFGVTGSNNRIKEVTVTIYWYDRNISGGASKKKESITGWTNNYLDY